MNEVMTSVVKLFELLERKNNEYVILSQEVSRRIAELKLDDEAIKKREQIVVAKEVKYGIVEFADKLRTEGEKIKRDAEMLLEITKEERKTVADWCDKEKRKVAFAMRELEATMATIKDKEVKLKEDRKILEAEKLNYKNTIIKSFDRKNYANT
jgi:hypothetical protein